MTIIASMRTYWHFASFTNEFS